MGIHICKSGRTSSMRSFGCWSYWWRDAHPVGTNFAKDVLGENPADGMSVLQTALGIGVAIGVALLPCRDNE